MVWGARWPWVTISFVDFHEIFTQLRVERRKREINDLIRGHNYPPALLIISVVSPWIAVDRAERDPRHLHALALSHPVITAINSGIASKLSAVDRHSSQCQHDVAQKGLVPTSPARDFILDFHSSSTLHGLAAGLCSTLAFESFVHAKATV